MATYHLATPHWYLAMIGVDPAHQRKGVGAALLETGLRRCDHDHVAAYLECSSVANVPFYQRHGFVLLGTVQPGSSPPVFPMLRTAR